MLTLLFRYCPSQQNDLSQEELAGHMHCFYLQVPTLSAKRDEFEPVWCHYVVFVIGSQSRISA